LTAREFGGALRRYVEPLHDALQCITRERLIVDSRSDVVAQPFTVALRDTAPVPLRGAVPLHIRVAQVAGLFENPPGQRMVSHEVRCLRYIYAFSTASDQEILAFHWTPDAHDANTVTFPHLHIGRAITAGQSAIRPRDIHKAHIPTGVVTLTAIVWLAITEFGVTPLRRNKEDVLLRAESVLSQSAPSVG
jgi:hypothetical protein